MSNINGSKPNFDSSQTVSYPDMSEVVFKDKGTTTASNGITRTTHSAAVSAWTGKQPGFSTFVTSRTQSGILRCDYGTKIRVQDTDEDSKVTYRAPLDTGGYFHAYEDCTAEMVAERVLMTMSVIIPSFTSGNAVMTRLWAALRGETNLLPNG